MSTMDQKGNRVLEFYKTLEDILKCPVCDKKLGGNVYMCGSGHSICNDCQNKGTQCTKCNAPYTKMENLLVQELLSKLDSMKVKVTALNSDNNHVGQTQPKIAKIQLKQDKIPVGTDQTSNAKGKLAPNKFRCCIVNDCGFIGCLAAVIDHFKNVHPLEYEEHSNGHLPYKQTWLMDSVIWNNLNRAFKISDDGVFMLHIWKNSDEELSACILMYARNLIACQHSYKIEIECNEKKISFNGQVESVRTLKQILLESGHKSLFIDRNEPLYNELRENSRFKCSVMVKKNMSIDTTTNANSNKEKNDNQQSGGGQKKNNDHHNTPKTQKDSMKKSEQINKSGIEKKKGQQKVNKAPNKQSTEINNSALKKEDNQDNKQRLTKTTNKHLEKLKNSLEDDINQSMIKNQLKSSQSDMNNFTKSSGIVYQPPYTYNQLQHPSNRMYPNLGWCGSVQTPTPNYSPSGLTQEMAYQCNVNVHQQLPLIDNNFHGGNIPNVSGSHACPSPVNPQFQPEVKNSTEEMKATQKRKEDDKCLVA